MKLANYDIEKNVNLASLGQFGLRVLGAASSSVSEEIFIAVQALEDSVVSADMIAYNQRGNGYVGADSPDQIGDEELTSLPISAGMIIYGRFTNISVTSGNIIAYKGM